MGKAAPDILALDFDGVLCDGLIEYFQTAWKAYCRIWPSDATAPTGLAERFCRLRPVVETGWEMPVVLRSLLVGVSDDDILQNWRAIAQQQIDTDAVTPQELSAAVDEIRDEWIAQDLNDWLAQQRFYPGVIDALQRWLANSSQVVIVTTKEGRFVKELLRQQQIDMPDINIFGKEVNQPKHETLRQLMFSRKTTSQPPTLWLVEDRLKTLQGIKQQSDLKLVRLYLADWGYNTESDRIEAEKDDRIQTLSLTQFGYNLTDWSISE
jgi:phosphoglycolate phosphatase-like HAD superfamily hydrolase